jgi:hypothetical protein
VPKAFYRDYVAGRRRAGQVKLAHILREDGPWAGKQALCSLQAWDVTDSRAVMLDPMPAAAPEGLRWCPRCVGLLAQRMGRLDLIVAELVLAGAGRQGGDQP